MEFTYKNSFSTSIENEDDHEFLNNRKEAINLLNTRIKSYLNNKDDEGFK